MVKNPPAVLETQVQSLGWEDPLEKRMATHSSILAWEITWTEPGGYSLWGRKNNHQSSSTICPCFPLRDFLVNIFP